MRGIAGLFGKSPFVPLQEHIVKVNSCVELLSPLFESMFNDNQEEFSTLIQKIYAFEQDADEIKNELRNTLPRTIFMPVSRPDFLVLLDVQDGMADTAQDIAVLLSARQPRNFSNIDDDVMKLVKYAVRSASQVIDIYSSLNDLLETTFRGKPVEKVHEVINKIGHTEHKADKTAYSLLQKLFNESGELSIQDFVMWDKVLNKLSHIADLARKTSNRIRIILSA